MIFELGTGSLDASFSYNVSITPTNTDKKIFSSDKTLNFDEFPLIFDKLEFNLDTTIPVSLQSSTKGASAAASGFSAILLFVSSSQAKVLIKIFQLVEVLQYLNVHLPTTVNAVLSNFKGDPLDMIPNPLQADEDDLNC